MAMTAASVYVAFKPHQQLHQIWGKLLQSKAKEKNLWQIYAWHIQRTNVMFNMTNMAVGNDGHVCMRCKLVAHSPSTQLASCAVEHITANTQNQVTCVTGMSDTCLVMLKSKQVLCAEI